MNPVRVVNPDRVSNFLERKFGHYFNISSFRPICKQSNLKTALGQRFLTKT